MNFIRKLYWLKKKLRWDIEYKKGKWDFMANEDEKPRYQKILDWLKIYKSNKILDLGCGDGVLADRIYSENHVEYFLGIDFSENAIHKAKSLNLIHSEFLVCDLHFFHTDKKFDLIIINEVLYYLDDWKKYLQLFSSFLNTDGVIILSLYKNKTEMIDSMYKDYDVLKFEKVEGLNGKSWDMMVLKNAK